MMEITRALEQVQICNCSSSSYGALFYYKVAPAPELLDTTTLDLAPELLDTTAPALAPELPDTTALAPLVKNLSSSMFVQFEVSSC